MQNRNSKNAKGAALVMAMLLLVIFGLLAAALMSTVALEGMISDNYQTNTQVLYLAEAGIDRARENLRVSTNDLTQILTTAAGADGVLSTSTSLATLSSIDQAYINNSTLTDLTGRNQGRYHVFIRNDIADGQTSVTDTNSIINLLSIGQFRGATKIVEVEVRRGAIPDFPAALTLDGPVPVGAFLESSSAIFDIDGNNSGSPTIPAKSAIGVISPAADTEVTTRILGPPDRSTMYVGAGGLPSVNDISTSMAPELWTPAGLEDVVADIASYATTTYNPPYNGSTPLSNVGSPTAPQTVVVNGDCVYGPGVGYGLLLVRGNLTFNGNFTWNGLVLVIGQGYMDWNGGAQGEINGEMFIAASRGLPRSASSPVGPILGMRGPIHANFNGGGGNGIHYNWAEIQKAYQGLPYRPISYRQY
jgi:Tfp pilus assembly protein PilX